MPPEIRRAFEERYGFRFLHAYGGTEGPAVVSTDPLDRERKFDSVGLPLPHILVTVEDDAGRRLAAGEVGEICTASMTEGPFAGWYEPMRAYWGMPGETAEALRGGRLHWGDLGYLDEDGFIYLVDRKKDMIIRGGMNVYPKELEKLLYADARIAECARWSARSCPLRRGALGLRAGGARIGDQRGGSALPRGRQRGALQTPRGRHLRRGLPAQRARQGSQAGAAPRPPVIED